MIARTLDFLKDRKCCSRRWPGREFPLRWCCRTYRPLAIPWAAGHAGAILEAWYPGEFGGRAIAETLFGDNNPGGRLSISFPRDIGQLPDYYNHFPSKGRDYVEENSKPLFAFGRGLSYTTFKYGHLAVTPPARGGSEDVQVTFSLDNTGDRDGDEVAQLYVRQKTASVATPAEGYSRRSYPRASEGRESRSLTLRVKTIGTSLFGATSNEWKVESGQYTVTVGGSSEGGLTGDFSL